MKANYNKTKIIATIGPASIDEAVLEKMILAGVDVCRINASHGHHDEIRNIVQLVRGLNEKLGTHVAILYDLQGPKIRIGDIEGGEVFLEESAEFILSTKEVQGTAKQAYIKYQKFCDDVKVGDMVLIDDGKIELSVTEIIDSHSVRTNVRHGGMLASRKGVNLPNTAISLPSLTPKDLTDLELALDLDVEWIGLSFVRKASDITELRQIIRNRHSHARIIAKIEKPEAVLAIEEIIENSDAVMVARGDLGVELPMQQVPVIQKNIVRKCNQHSKPVIIATQMMESMIQNYRPTRAEANDVGNAVFDGADALMLSGETSVGKYPLKTVEAMQKIIRQVEKETSIYFRETPPRRHSSRFIPESISYTACTMARQADAAAIVAMTHSGMTAFLISSHRPRANIYIFTDNKALLTTLNLVWGVHGFYYDKYESSDTTFSEIRQWLSDNGWLRKGDYMVHVASTPLHERTTANTIKLAQIH